MNKEKSQIRFQCQGSGNCCTSRGEYGYVYLSDPDRERLSAHLGKTVEDFTSQFCDHSEGYTHLKHPEKDCRFLVEQRCSVYEARPGQCRTWPFWPENFRAKKWKREIASFCPGIGKGPVWSSEKIESALGEHRRFERELEESEEFDS